MNAQNLTTRSYIDKNDLIKGRTQKERDASHTFVTIVKGFFFFFKKGFNQLVIKKHLTNNKKPYVINFCQQSVHLT